jgi:hypothetical protein
VDVALSAGMLQYARSLLEFYSSVRHDLSKTEKTTGWRKAKPTDIVLEDFDGSRIDDTTVAQFAAYRAAIEVHLLHLTAWRDVDYRKQHANGSEGQARQRFDWDSQAVQIAQEIIDALGVAANRMTDWRTPFDFLHGVTDRRLTDPTYEWPRELKEKADVDAYLQQQSLR